MAKTLVVLDKYSDWLEVYSVFEEMPTSEIEVHIVEDIRNDVGTVEMLMAGILPKASKFTLVGHSSKRVLFKKIFSACSELIKGDIFVAPFIRYRDYWKLTKIVHSDVLTVHISECIPDTFGHIGYRIGFRGKKFKTWLSLPFAKFYAMTHMPKLCYFPLYPKMENPFVKESRSVHIPPLVQSKADIMREITKGVPRTLIIGGFGYDISKIAKVLNLTQYIATSKGLELIIDGAVIPLKERICAEEVLLSGYVSRIVGYTSSAMIWARILFPDMPIECYEAKEFNRYYGKYFNKFAFRSLNEFGIEVMPENEKMIENVSGR